MNIYFLSYMPKIILIFIGSNLTKESTLRGL